MTKQHYQIKWLLDETRGFETCQRENKITKKAGRVKRSTKRRNARGEVFYSPQHKKNAAEWDRATIWLQLRVMHRRSTKIDDNNSTLDAHHYPDGVLGELHRPPNQEQAQHRQNSDTAAHLDDSHWFCLYWWQCWRAALTTVPWLWESPLLVFSRGAETQTMHTK